ncbi:MAG: hypothetical protein ACOCY7_03685 [Halodesulfurarchaeum sp.]
MASAIRLYVRTGILGAWAAIFGFVILFVTGRLLHVLREPQSVPPDVGSVGVSFFGILSSVVVPVYNGGVVSVAIGVVLVMTGWYRLLRLV